MKYRVFGSRKYSDIATTAGESDAQLDTSNIATQKKLKALDALFAESQESPEEFHGRYVKPLLEEGVSLDEIFDLLVTGAVGAN
jgi:hypothetical protein